MFQTALDENRRLRYTTILVICFSLVAPLLLMYFITPWLKPLVGQTAYMAIYEICFWVMALVVLAVVLCWERESLRSIGLRGLTVKEGLLSLLVGMLLFVLVPTLGIFMERVLGIATSTMEIVAALAKYPIWFRALLSARAGLVEEVLYRGYPIERVNRLTGRIWPGVLISLIIHTALHIPHLGIGHTVAVVFPLSTLLAGLYVWKRNLTLNIIVHFLIDLFAMVLLPLLPFFS